MKNKTAAVIILNYNGAKLLEANLPSVITAVKKASLPTKIVVADNGSADQSAHVVKKFPEVEWLGFPKNYGFGDGNNRAVKEVKTDIIVLLNTDINVKDDFLSPLYHALDDENVFAAAAYQHVVSPNRTYDDGGTMAEWRRGLLRHRPVFEIYPDQKFVEPIPTFYASGGASAFDRQKFLSLGGFSPIFRPFYWEDADLSFRAWKKGWKSVFVPKSACDHRHESTTSAVATPIRKKAYGWKGIYLFTWRAIDRPQMLIEHLAWTPIHIINALINRRWEQFWGFGLASPYLFTRIPKSECKFSTKEVIERSAIKQNPAAQT